VEPELYERVSGVLASCERAVADCLELADQCEALQLAVRDTLGSIQDRRLAATGTTTVDHGEVRGRVEAPDGGPAYGRDLALLHARAGAGTQHS
jgi:hypothetical protein